MRDIKKFTSRFFDLVEKYQECTTEGAQGITPEKQQMAQEYYGRMKQQFSCLDAHEILQFNKHMSTMQFQLETEGYREKYKYLFAAISLSEKLIPEIMFDTMFDKLSAYDQNYIIKGRHVRDLEAIKTRIFNIFQDFSPEQARKFMAIIEERRDLIFSQPIDSGTVHKLEIYDELECMLTAFHQYLELEQKQ